MPDNPDAKRYAMHAFGAQFAEVRVHQDSGEVRVPRLLGVFAAGRLLPAIQRDRSGCARWKGQCGRDDRCRSCCG
jgi:hypothetical protein